MTRPARALPEPIAVNLTTTAALLNKSVSQVKRYIKQGLLPVSYHLGTPLVLMSDIRKVAGETINGKAK